MAYLKCLVLSGKIIPDGSTVLPTDDIQIWLHCAGIFDKNYTTLSQVLSDSDTLLTLMTTDNAVDYMIRSITWVSAICGDSGAMADAGASDYTAYAMLSNATWCEAVIGSTYVNDVSNVQVPKMTSATAPSGAVTADSTYATYYAWYPFRENNTVAWLSNHSVAKNSTATGWLQYMFKRAVKIYAITYTEPNTISQVISEIIKASNDGINFDDIGTDLYPNPSNAYKYWRMQMIAKNVYSSATYVPRILTMQFYGRGNAGVQTWLKSAGINKSYTTLAQVLADTTTLTALISSQDACDYLVTAKGFIDDIVADQTAMTLIGANNYASTLLLSDVDWLEAIANSQYSSLVANVQVPKMTSATAPSGEVTQSSSYNSTLAGWKAFDRIDYTSSNNNRWVSANGSKTNQWVQYAFTKAVRIYGVFIEEKSPNGIPKNMKIQVSDDNSTFTDVDTFTNSSSAIFSITRLLSESNAHKYWRVFFADTYGANYIDITTIQFYGREDV